MSLAPLQRLVRCVRSKEGTRSDDSRLVLHVLLPATSSYYFWSSVCCAWSTIHSRTAKPFTASLASGTTSHRSLSLGTAVLCPWCWLKENIQQAALCLWPSLVFLGGLRFSVTPPPYRPRYSGSPVLKRDSVGSATMKSYFQADAENYSGNLKPHPFGWQPAEYALQRITLSLTSSPGLWLCAAF